MCKEEKEIKPYAWIEGKIARINIRKNYYGTYLDIYFNPKNTKILKGRASVSINKSEKGEYKRLLKYFNVDLEEELKGKEVYYKFYIKKVLTPLKENFYDCVETKNIFKKEDYESQIILLKMLNSNEGIINSLNRLFKPSKEANKNIKKKSVGAYIGLKIKNFVTPINEIDLNHFYSNILLTNEWCPKNDEDRSYLEIVKLLNKARENKEILGSPIEDTKRLKVLTEALIGCLNNSEFVFYDPELYQRIVNEGKRIIQRVLIEIKRYKQNLKDEYLEIIRIHTDGIFLKSKQKTAKELVRHLNSFLEKNESYLYTFRHEGYYQRGIFKDVNNFALYIEGQKTVTKGTFFKEEPLLVEKFLEGYYPRNLANYEDLKEKLLKEKNPKIIKILIYLEKLKI